MGIVLGALQKFEEVKSSSTVTSGQLPQSLPSGQSGSGIEIVKASKDAGAIVIENKMDDVSLSGFKKVAKFCKKNPLGALATIGVIAGATSTTGPIGGIIAALKALNDINNAVKSDDSNKKTALNPAQQQLPENQGKNEKKEVDETVKKFFS